MVAIVTIPGGKEIREWGRHRSRRRLRRRRQGERKPPEGLGPGARPRERGCTGQGEDQAEVLALPDARFPPSGGSPPFANAETSVGSVCH
jgi:hypothetical protein